MRFVCKEVKSIFNETNEKRSMIVLRPKMFMDKDGLTLLQKVQTLLATLWNMKLKGESNSSPTKPSPERRHWSHCRLTPLPHPPNG